MVCSSLIFILSIALAHAGGKEASIYVTALKNEGINDKILSSPIFEACKKEVDGIENITEKDSKEKIRQCLDEAITGADDKELEKVGQNLEINTVDFDQTKGSKSIREFLSKRIYEAIHGEDYENKRLKELKHIDHSLFLKLYESQVSKNLILDVSRYCLENIGMSDNPGSYISYVTPSGDVPEPQKARGFDYSLEQMLESAEGAGLGVQAKTVFREDTKAKTYLPLETPVPNPKSFKGRMGVASFWDSIQEYRYCPQLRTSDKNDPCYYQNARDQRIISALKEDELKQGQENPEVLGNKYSFCSTFLVRNMCEIYKCNNVYDWSNPNKENIKYCKNNLGISSPSSSKRDDSLEITSHKNKKGQLACNLISKVEGYKKTMMAIAQAKENQKELKTFSGLDLGQSGFTGGEYIGRGDNGSKSIDEITSVSSKELVASAKALGEGEEKAKQLSEECFENGFLVASKDECQDLGSSMNEQDFAKIQLDTEAQTKAYLERVRKLKDNPDDEELEAMLIKHGLHDYVGKLDEFPVEDLIQLIEDKYKTERMALINNMRDRFYSMTKKKKDDDESLAAVAKDQLKEVESHKERIETLLNYSNIVSSYLQVEDQDGNKFKNTTTRMVEREGFEKHATDKDEAQRQNYEAYFADTEQTKSSSGSVNAGQLIDGILGIGAVN